MAKKKSKKAVKAKPIPKSKSKTTPKATTESQIPKDPFKLFMYHFVRLPWYFVKFWDWIFTLITALIVYLTR
jgi:hypothetical protein